MDSRGDNVSFQPTGQTFRVLNDLHGLYAYLSKTAVELPDGYSVRKLEWSKDDGCLGFSCGSTLKVLTLQQPMDIIHEQATQASEKDTGHEEKTLNELGTRSLVESHQTLKLHSDEIRCLSFNHVHGLLATGDSIGRTIVWRKHGGEWIPEHRHNPSDDSGVSGLAWSSDGAKLCIVRENGSIRVGSVDGSHMWSQQENISPGEGIVWSPDFTQILIPTIDGEIYAYDSSNGDFLGKGNFRSTTAGVDKKLVEPSDAFGCKTRQIATIRWFHGPKSDTNSAALPSLAVVFRWEMMYLLRGLDDEKPVILKTNLIATCGDWSPDGDYFAAAGETWCTKTKAKPETRPTRSDKVLIFSATGQLMLEIRLPDRGPDIQLSSLAWDSSQRVAIGAGSRIYFANICVRYKFAIYAQRILVYAFGEVDTDGVSHLGFWDQEKFCKQFIEGLVVDVKGNDELCAILAYNDKGVYNVLLVNDQQLPIDNINISKMKPFQLVLTDSTVSCIAPNAVHIWKYKTMGNRSSMRAFDHSLPNYFHEERTIHLDEKSNFSSLLRKTESIEEMRMPKATQDPAIWADGVNLFLVVLRASGKILIYSLPFGMLISSFESFHQMSIRATRVFVNSTGTELALVDGDGILYSCKLSGSSSDSAVKIYDKKNVLDVAWAKDNPDVFCVMEESKIYVLQNGDVQDTISVPSPTHFAHGHVGDLQITTVSMNELMKRPESPKASMIHKFDMKMLREMKYLVAQNTPASNLRSFVEKSNHPLLWRVLGQFTFRTLDLGVAEIAFVKCQDYSGLQSIKKLRCMCQEDKRIQQAHVANYYEDFHHAQNLYLECQRSDLAIKMWSGIKNWKNLTLLLARLSASKQPSLTTQALVQEKYSNCKGDSAFQKFEIEKAIVYYEQAKNVDRILECAMMLENCDILEDMRNRFHDDENILDVIDNYMQFFTEEFEEDG